MASPLRTHQARKLSEHSQYGCYGWLERTKKYKVVHFQFKSDYFWKSQKIIYALGFYESLTTRPTVNQTVNQRWSLVID